MTDTASPEATAPTTPAPGAPTDAVTTARLRLRRIQLWLLAVTAVWLGLLVTAVVFGLAAFFSDGGSRTTTDLALAGTFGIAALVLCAVDALVRVLLLRAFRNSLR